MTTPLEWLTATLVVITAYYAWQTRKTVHEMKEAREAGVRPQLVPIVEYATTKIGTVSVENIGPGPALDISLVLTFLPNGTAYRISRYLLRSGDRRLWNPGRDGQAEQQPQEYHPDAYLPNHTGIHLTGRCRDLFGQWHDIDEHTMVLNKWEMTAPNLRESIERDFREAGLTGGGDANRHEQV